MGKITVTNVGKAYKQYPTRWSRLAEWILPGKRQHHNLKWVIQDVSFDIEPGQAVGIIGINGAGKSTLLKMITGTTQPTIGSIQLTGRVAALLELGMGFHPDFTGRENVYMAGQLLGLSTDEINASMPVIEAFSEIGSYIEQPVRIYSSGMQMRLAFSIATAVRPDILIVDEALSVGDAHFQHKCFDRIREFQKLGTTLLIVSHDKQAIQSICDKAILLNSGRVEMQGEPETVMDYYNALLASGQKQEISQVETPEGRTQTISGTGEARVLEIELSDDKGNTTKCINVGQNVNLRIVVEANADLPQLVLGYSIKDRLGQTIYGTNTFLEQQILEDVRVGQKFEFVCSFAANLGPGNYSIQTALVSSDNHLDNNYEWRDLALIFEIVNIDKTPFSGLTWLDSKIGIRTL
ncbi:ABC transporter ATP-binding protein [Vibrio cholerae]|nr:ABC transporter ATP-binding protein [Vibrio cholerae]HCJ6812265.1 ABC transporter ATP-binding protein [Vibrio cholerae]HCJ7284244.1 ABC transporter ATP-binding protein [Vibrio cholerae]HCJ7315125.1 ABC transporter ATP-binding protein [Vibrio cholerae]HCJ7322209.1 ABC transporter ATP-binding protein [Vibrio cholerae]